MAIGDGLSIVWGMMISQPKQGGKHYTLRQEEMIPVRANRTGRCLALLEGIGKSRIGRTWRRQKTSGSKVCGTSLPDVVIDEKKRD